jgi:hypothetical protein
MNITEIRKWQKQQPFEPFEILLVDGRLFHVPHPDFIFVPPGHGTWVYVADEEGSADHINTAVISSIRKARNGRSRRRKAG